MDNLYQDMNDYRRKAGAAPLTRDYGMEEIMGNAGCSITKGHGHNTKEVNLPSNITCVVDVDKFTDWGLLGRAKLRF